MAAALAAERPLGSPCCASAAASAAADAADGSRPPSRLNVDSSSWRSAATVRSSRLKLQGVHQQLASAPTVVLLLARTNAAGAPRGMQRKRMAACTEDSKVPAVAKVQGMS